MATLMATGMLGVDSHKSMRYGMARLGVKQLALSKLQTRKESLKRCLGGCRSHVGESL